MTSHKLTTSFIMRAVMSSIVVIGCLFMISQYVSARPQGLRQIIQVPFQSSSISEVRSKMKYMGNNGNGDQTSSSSSSFMETMNQFLNELDVYLLKSSINTKEKIPVESLPQFTKSGHLVSYSSRSTYVPLAAIYLLNRRGHYGTVRQILDNLQSMNPGDSPLMGTRELVIQSLAFVRFYHHSNEYKYLKQAYLLSHLIEKYCRDSVSGYNDFCTKAQSTNSLKTNVLVYINSKSLYHLSGDDLFKNQMDHAFQHIQQQLSSRNDMTLSERSILLLAKLIKPNEYLDKTSLTNININSEKGIAQLKREPISVDSAEEILFTSMALHEYSKQLLVVYQFSQSEIEQYSTQMLMQLLEVDFEQWQYQLPLAGLAIQHIVFGDEYANVFVDYTTRPVSGDALQAEARMEGTVIGGYLERSNQIIHISIFTIILSAISVACLGAYSLYKYISGRQPSTEKLTGIPTKRLYRTLPSTSPFTPGTPTRAVPQNFNPILTGTSSGLRMTPGTPTSPVTRSPNMPFSPSPLTPFDRPTAKAPKISLFLKIQTNNHR